MSTCDVTLEHALENATGSQEAIQNGNIFRHEKMGGGGNKKTSDAINHLEIIVIFLENPFFFFFSPPPFKKKVSKKLEIYIYICKMPT